ncbi:MAG TPA: translation elongation factor Ts [Planctomycetota bacterium]|nr:translation elongation factor Ts [Planctomycetota bacterium]
MNSTNPSPAKNMDITSKMVQDLRERSGAPLMDCKRALVATNGDVDAAFDFLRKAGLKTADKKAGRSMGAGRVGALIAPDGRAGAMVALSCETDFSANTEDFGAMVASFCKHALQHRPATPAEMLGQKLQGGVGTLDDTLKQLVGKIGENMQLSNVAVYENKAGRVGAYVHHTPRVGALVSVTSDAPAEKVDAFIKQLGMHIASSKPTALTRAAISAEVIEREKAVYRESDDVKGKPAERLGKILEGKLEKFFQGTVLGEQPWVMDPALTVDKALAAALGQNARIEAFSLFQVGA